MSEATIIRVSGSLLRISGDINFANARQLMEQGEQLLSEVDTHCEIDFAGVDRAGSAALALLCGWLRCARRLDKQPVYTHLPDGLMGVARVSGVDELLPIR